MTYIPLFDRQYLLSIAPNPTSETSFFYGNANPKAAPLRVTFDIKKDTTPDKNPAHIVIYNLAENTRRSIKPGWALQLQAGYKSTMATVWLGQVGKGIASRSPDLSVADKASTKREGADISYAIESAEGLGPLSYATIKASYKDGTSLSQVFDDIKAIITKQTPATSFGITIGSIPSPLPLGKVKRSLALNCSCADALTMIFEPINYDWFIHNNELCVCSKAFHTQDGVPFISATTGLIGIPSREDGGVVTIKTLLNPQLAPGRLLELKSQDNTFDGFYKVKKMQHRGDTHGEQWETEVSCIAFETEDAPIDTQNVE